MLTAVVVGALGRLGFPQVWRVQLRRWRYFASARVSRRYLRTVSVFSSGSLAQVRTKTYSPDPVNFVTRKPDSLVKFSWVRPALGDVAADIDISVCPFVLLKVLQHFDLFIPLDLPVTMGIPRFMVDEPLDREFRESMMAEVQDYHCLQWSGVFDYCW